MRMMTYAAGILSAITLGSLCVTPAHAGASPQTTYVAVGGGNFPSVTCGLTNPCGQISDAITQAGLGGTVIILDSGLYFQNVTITKSVTIAGTLLPTISTPLNSSPGFTINTPGIEVTLRGLILDGEGAMTAGVLVNSAGEVRVERCLIKNFNGVSGAAGVSFKPTNAAKLVMQDTLLLNNGNGATGGGLVINPSGVGTAQVVLERVVADNNVFGIAVDGTGGTGGINMTISNSAASGNSHDGIIATTPGGGAPIGVYVKNSKSANNAFGIRSLGPNVTVRVDGSSVIGNGTGLAFGSGGALLSFGNNAVQANGSNGAFSGSAGLQ